jgi:hypothetical protein
MKWGWGRNLILMGLLSASIGGCASGESIVRFNAKNPNGAYAGVRDQMAIFLSGKLDQMGFARDLCKDAAYEPFPELERLTR